MPNQGKPRISGAIFQNTSGRGPEYTGVIEINGVKEQIAFWPKTSAAGKPYLQISEDRKKPQQGASPQAPARPSPQRPVGYQPGPAKMPNPDDDMDDTIPF